MAKNNTEQTVKRKPSKRERRIKLVIYIMIIAMVLSTVTMGLSMFI
ncbi:MULTISPECIES: stressosome-associated protein Prli42 [Sediminibacillus]|nr:stressosome-associated protein Prli42 [Sediminibacillus terrae]